MTGQLMFEISLFKYSIVHVGCSLFSWLVLTAINLMLQYYVVQCPLRLTLLVDRHEDSSFTRHCRRRVQNLWTLVIMKYAVLAWGLCSGYSVSLKNAVF